MRTPINGVTPEAWLSRQGLSQDKRSEVLDSFRADSVVRVFTYRAPHLFLRAHGKRSRDPIFKPNYWADGNAWGSAYDRAGQFELFLSDDEIRLIARNYYRELTAICHNWNDLEMSSFWKISLRGSEIVEGIEGPAADVRRRLPYGRTGVCVSATWWRAPGLPEPENALHLYNCHLLGHVSVGQGRRGQSVSHEVVASRLPYRSSPPRWRSPAHCVVRTLPDLRTPR